MAITYKDLVALNPSIKNPNLIKVGQTLTLPDGSSYTVTKGDTLSGIASTYSTQLTATTNGAETQVLEAWQADNRAELQAQENTIPQQQVASEPVTSVVVDENPQPEVQTDVNPEEDPFEQARQDAIAAEETSPTEQDVIDAEEDPFEQARLRNAQDEEETSPNEQTVIDASTDEELHAQDQAALEKEQEANRAKLKAEESTTPAAATSPAKVTSDATSAKFAQAEDWRVRLSLAPSANYLYKAAKSGEILFPLKATNGVLFPYTPQISVNYKANYDPSDLTHSNYKIMMYKNSVVDDVQITCDFTAQDTKEADYLLAVIHFFRSATKMFYGQDGKSGPRAGTPPPLVYLSGFGAYQFDNHPLVITNFNFTSPTDVDYIRAGVSETWGGQGITQSGTKEYASSGSVFGQLAEGLRDIRLKIGNLKKGAAPKEPQFKSLSNKQATYVPTKIQLQISASPVVSRNDISNNFSLTDYATGKLLRGSQRNGGGIW